jgi:hypothetical protein
MQAAKRKYGLSHLATEDVSDFDTSDWVVYSEEEPNSLMPEQVPLFRTPARAAPAALRDRVAGLCHRASAIDPAAASAAWCGG